jgi:hypothetical protein
MSIEPRVRWAFLGFPLAGLVSALLPVFFNFSRVFGDTVSQVLMGGMFGAFNGLCCYWFMGLRSIWRIAGFIIASIVAYDASIVAAFWAHRNLTFVLDKFRTRSSPIGAETLFVGGFTGAFIILLAALLLLSPRQKIASVLRKGFLGAVIGGFLGIVGHAAGPLVYRLRLLLPPMGLHGGDFDISLAVFWQTGMAFVLALILWFEKDRHEAAGRATA